MSNKYNDLYKADGLYWGDTPSKTCDRVIEFFPAKKDTQLLVVGCGEGRNAIHLAKQGYTVTAFDLSPVGVDKTKSFAKRNNLTIEAFVADVCDFRLSKQYEVIFSVGTLHYLEQKLRKEILDNYKEKTAVGGIHVLSVFIDDASLSPAPDAEPDVHLWKAGELHSYYQGWKIEYYIEEIFDCNSGGKPHQHATSRIIARRP